MLSRIKKNDLVVIVSGKDKGKQGQVIEVDSSKNLVLVKGIGLITKHCKPRRQGDKGGIVTEESFISTSKVMPVCPSCKKGCRVRVKFLEDGAKKIRVCHHCKDGAALD